MKFLDVNGLITKARRYVSQGQGVSEADVTEPKKLAEVLRGILKQLSELSGKVGPEPLEIEKVVAGSGQVAFYHGFDCPVRYYVTHWSNASGGPAFVWHASSTPKILVLTTGNAGRVILRIEPVQAAGRAG